MLSEWSNLVVAGEAADGREAVKRCRRLRADLVLMDVRMPKMDGFEATREIKRELPSTIVLVLTAFEEPDYLLEALKAGASGYVLKHMDPQQIVGPIRRVLEGECPLNQEVAMQLLRRLIEEKQQGKQATSKPSLSIPLSPREMEALEFLVRGQSNQQIASDLSISMSTVKNHVHRIITKLGVSDRVQAAIVALYLRGRQLRGVVVGYGSSTTAQRNRRGLVIARVLLERAKRCRGVSSWSELRPSTSRLSPEYPLPPGTK